MEEFSERPNINEEENFQQEYAGEEDCCECENYKETGKENQLRARPSVVPSPMTYGPGVGRHPGHHQHPHHLPRKRGPLLLDLDSILSNQEFLE